MPSSTLQVPGASDWLSQVAKAYLTAHPRHGVTFVCNTVLDTETMQAKGLDALTINQNCLVDDSVFRPLSDVEPVYDAIYNARLSPRKRHQLAAQVESLILTYFYNPLEGSPAEFHAMHARYQAMMPKAHFANELTPDGCRWIPGEQINRYLAMSRVGLCLSELEGAMRVAIEYLFAGLPVVATPSLGGREYFFDDEFCIITEPDPRSVREAVDAVVARNIPRDYIRARTLARVESERRKYIDFVQGLIDRSGGRTRFEPRFWQFTRDKSIVRWRSMKEFAATVHRELANDRAGRAGRRASGHVGGPS